MVLAIALAILFSVFHSLDAMMRMLYLGTWHALSKWCNRPVSKVLGRLNHARQRVGGGRVDTHHRQVLDPLALLGGHRLDSGSIPQPARRQSRQHRADSEALAVAAHELRTPLATLTATVELLEDHLVLATTDVRELVAHLERGVSWMTGLVENLDTWSAIRDNRLTICRQAVLVEEWIRAAIELTQPHLQRRGQRVLLETMAPGLRMIGDPQRLTQVMTNLLSNAARYGADDDDIIISVSVAKDVIKVSVKDHGPGMATEDCARIFERHHRGTRANEAAPDGRGLGLYIVRCLVELHGGTIDVDSAVGKGTQFCIRLPYHGPDA